MNRKRSGKIIIDCLKSHIGTFIVTLIIFLSSGAVFALYGLPIEPFVYALALGLTALACVLVVSLVKAFRAAARREAMKNSILTGAEFPPTDSLAESDYREMITTLDRRLNEITTECEKDRKKAEDYITVWVHQIKTPIAVMRMTLTDSDTEESRKTLAELFRIEQYVDMMLQYIRLSSTTNDLVIKEYSLDELIRQSVRKFSPQFVLRKVGFKYDGTDRTVVTDSKWFSCILDQFLSNAIKYTRSGGNVSVKVDRDGIHIADTGIGISKEDLPRIFEKGYTGLNGRNEQHSSGLGLYLARLAANKLALEISAESEPGKGSVFTICLPYNAKQ